MEHSCRKPRILNAPSNSWKALAWMSRCPRDCKTWEYFALPSRLQDAGVCQEDIDELHRQCLMFKKIEQGPGELTTADVTAMYREIA